MCGVTGFIDYATRGHNSARVTLAKMTDAIAHRGPNGEGFWLDPDFRVCLGNRRLSVVDLSQAGAQPMTSESGRYTITYNGEIYGYRRLRTELEERGVRFRGHSDTEVLLATVEAYGFENALRRFNGMFAFALYDSRLRQVIFARDRLGKKPLYVGVNGNTVAFGSELKSIRAHPAFSMPDMDLGSVTLFLRHGYVPTPYSIYQGIFKLMPGCWTALSIDNPPASIAEVLAGVKTYWSAFEIAERGNAERIDDENEALELLDSTLRTAVGERMVADVPVGTFLSGGIDSSLISAVLQELSATRIKTYTIRFSDAKYNEADTALEIADHLNTEHTELTVTPQMTLERISRIPEIYDEPFADPSQIPTFMLSELARANITVALSGDGGDEIFAGYNRYPQMILFERLSRKTPALALRAIRAMPNWLLDAGLVAGRRSFPPCFREEATSDRIKKLAVNLQSQAFDARYREFLSHWKIPSEIVLGGHEPPNAMNSGDFPSTLTAIERMMYLDMVAYLPDDVLVKVDRASMAVGLEVRSPLLDHRIVEAAWRAPRSLCQVGGRGKIALRRLLNRHLPEKFSNLPKRGFSVPINDWLRGSLRNWADEVLSPARLSRDEIFKTDAITACWKEHLSGKRNWGSQLWTVLMFNSWLDRWCSS